MKYNNIGTRAGASVMKW